jgi:hypothetical protein
METYEIDLLRADGRRDCLLMTQCRGDRLAIALAKSIFENNCLAASRVVVSRGNEAIYETVRYLS